MPVVWRCQHQDHTLLHAGEECWSCKSPRFEGERPPSAQATLSSGVHPPSILGTVLADGVVPPTFRTLLDSTFVPGKDTIYLGQAGAKLAAKAKGRRAEDLLTLMLTAGDLFTTNGTVTSVLQKGKYSAVSIDSTPTVPFIPDTPLLQTSMIEFSVKLNGANTWDTSAKNFKFTDIGKRVWAVQLKANRHFSDRRVRYSSSYFDSGLRTNVLVPRYRDSEAYQD
jgi:hypothetical protein